MMTSWLILCGILISLHAGTTLELKRISVLEVTAVEGGVVTLPCEAKHPPDDSVYLVLWFNDNLTTPIYRYDIRYGEPEPTAHWTDTSVLENRASLTVSKKVAELQISPVKEKDEGFYKCRVDYRKNPTKTTRIQLKIIVPPKEMKITTNNAEVASVIGPMMVGDFATIKCTVYGGRPTPRVYWFYGEDMVDDEVDFIPATTVPTVETGKELSKWVSNRRYVVENTLSLGPFTRNDLKKLVTCEASNTNLTSPLSTVFMIDMNLPPLAILTNGPTEPVSAGRTYVLSCQVIGSRPPPSIAWKKGSTRIQGDEEITSTDGNITKSSLSFIPTPPDDGTTITCLAKNAATDSSIHRTLALNVYYVPEVLIKLATFLDARNIKEGDDVYFECSILANPKVYKIAWTHNGNVLEHNITNGVIVSNQSLVLQNVRRTHAGRYSCTASNIEGDGTANPVVLDVKYAPVCVPDQQTTYGVAKKEDAEVTCRVNANPPAKTFRWRFNNTADTIDVPSGRYTTAPQSSIITYTPVTELDFGTLLCWADNPIGTQDIPCVFHIVAAGRPDSPTNCSITKRMSSSFGVWCQPGFDGGLHQVFHIRVSTPTGIGVNFTNGVPIFQIDNQSPGTTYRLDIWAANDKGSSVPVHLEAFTLNNLPNGPSHGPSEAEVRENSVDHDVTGTNHKTQNLNSKRTLLDPEWDITGFIPIICGATVGGILILIVLVLVIRHSIKRRTLYSSNDEIHHQCQSSSAMLIQSRHSGSSVVCETREIQLENEELFDRELLPVMDLEVSGPLIQPPSSYGSEEKQCFTYQLHPNEGSPLRGYSHSMTDEETPLSYQQQRSTPTNSSVSGQHLHNQSSLRHHIIQRPRCSNEVFNTVSTTSPLGNRKRGPKDVPTVYATLGSRHVKSGVGSIRGAHSQIDMASGISDEACIQPHLKSQPPRIDIRADVSRRRSVDQEAVNKRESSV